MIFRTTNILPAILIGGLTLRAFGTEVVRPPYPEKAVEARTFTARIPTHWEAHQVEYRDKTKDWLEISDSNAKPVDKYFRHGEHPGRIRVSIQLVGPFKGLFPTPQGATGAGKAVKLPGVRGQEWIHTSPSPHELGEIRSVLIVLGTSLYRLIYFLPVDTEQNGVIDRVIVSLKPKKNVETK